MHKSSLLFAGVLFVGGVSAAASPTIQPDARMAPVFENVLLLHVADAVSIPMFFRADGSVYYIDLHLHHDDIGENYTRTVTWKRMGDELCVLKGEETPCFVLPELKVGEAVDTAWRVLGAKGEVLEKGDGKLMLLRGRPVAAALDRG